MSKLAAEGGTPLRTAPWPAWPVFDEADVEAVADVVRSGAWSTNSGQHVRDFEKAFAEFQGAAHGIAVNSGASALQVALAALGVGGGDQVVVPTYTYVATANAALMLGAIPVLVDVEADTYNLDPDATKRAITQRTKAILPVHFSGAVANMDRLCDIARQHNLPLVEDASHAHGARWQGQGLGSLGSLGCFSFQASKNLNCGEGGIILTNDDNLAQRCRMLMSNGRLPGGVWYGHYLPGGTCRMTEMQGALLQSQLRRLESQTRRRDANGRYLNERLGAIEGIAPMQRDPRQDLHSQHLYMFRYDADKFGQPRAEFLKLLSAEGVPASGGYAIPLHQQPLFTGQGLPGSVSLEMMPHLVAHDYSRVQSPNAERACSREAVWLCQSVLLAETSDMDDIVAAIKKIRACRE